MIQADKPKIRDISVFVRDIARSHRIKTERRRPAAIRTQYPWMKRHAALLARHDAMEQGDSLKDIAHLVYGAATAERDLPAIALPGH